LPASVNKAAERAAVSAIVAKLSGAASFSDASSETAGAVSAIASSAADGR
jgi:hypothetical protein